MPATTRRERPISTLLPYTNALFRRYGETYTSYILGQRFVFTYNAENTKHILFRGLPGFDSSPLRKHMFECVTPHGIFTLDGEAWKVSRDQLRSRLSNPQKIVNLAVCEQLFQSFCKLVPPDGQAFNIQEAVFALSLDVQTSLFLGESVDALSPMQSQGKKQFVHDILLVKNRIVQDGFRGPLRHLFNKRAFLQGCKRMQAFVETCAAKAAGESMEERRLFTDQVLSILLANDSMGTTLSGLFFCLSQDERVVQKLRQNVFEALGIEPPTWNQLGTLHYVRWSINEALRLYPPAVVNARLANKHTTLPTGGGQDRTSPVFVRKGDIIVFSTWARHRLGTEFGDNPEQFYPERWEGLNTDMPGFIPFNKGPRICPGQHHAMAVLTYMVARMFQTYSRVLNYNTEPWKERISMTLENGNGVFVGLS
ncbi:cytochrome P450 [Aspergillus undulatus]|uniref:cytochrome P450 n=1 Tax=Aspergillus undulatus TaxID=1810928 RepID=UPI003CCDF998